MTSTATTGAVSDDPRDAVEQLADRAWQHLAEARGQHPSVVPATCAPVLYFGDRHAYETSPLRVMTVGLNPSDREFPMSAPWGRFPGAASRESYLGSLNAYFRQYPLRGWFSAWREVLHGLEGCFWDHRPSTALHTDLCSVVPTSPTWSRLPKEVRADLMQRGVPLWHDLVAELRPQVILSSVAYRHLDRITFPPLDEWRPVHTVERTNPYVVEARPVALPDGTSSLLVRGRAANTPFGSVKNTDRHAIGRSIREHRSD